MSENQAKRADVGRVPPRGETVGPPANAASGDAAYNEARAVDVGRVPSHGETVGPPANAASGDAAYNEARVIDVGRVPSRVPSHGVPKANEPPPRRLRRLHRVWPDRDGNISYLLTMCVDGRARMLDNEDTFERFVAFLLDSPQRYHWFGRRFVVMPDHIHLIARMGQNPIRLGQWIKALKSVVAGLERREGRPARAPGLQDTAPPAPVGRLRSAGAGVGRVFSRGAASGDAAYNATRPSDVGPVPSPGDVGRVPPCSDHEFTRIRRAWRWQDGYHDHKFRTPESESRKWEYVCLNPVRYGLVKYPEEWPFGGEIFYDEAGGPRLVRGTPPLLETGSLIEEDGTPRKDCKTPGPKTPGEGTRPTPSKAPGSVGRVP